MSATDGPSSESVDDLSFAKAEFEEGQTEFACSFCGRELRDFYFQVNGAPSCEQCRYEVEALRSGGSSSGRLLRAIAGGLAAAALGALLYYAVLSITGYEIGLIAIVVGFMVGWAVRWGARHRGGWGYQALAVGLTYVAIVSTYVPLMFEAAEDMGIESASSSTTDLGIEASPQLADQVAYGELTFGEKALSVLFVLGVVLALPFLGGLENIIGLLIIFFALAQAWSMNKRLQLEIEGPFEVGSLPPALEAPADDR